MSMPERGSTEWAQMKERYDAPEDRAEREADERERTVVALAGQLQRRVPPGQSEVAPQPSDDELISMVEKCVDRYGVEGITAVLRLAMREAWPDARQLSWKLAELHYGVEE